MSSCCCPMPASGGCCCYGRPSSCCCCPPPSSVHNTYAYPPYHHQPTAFDITPAAALNANSYAYIPTDPRRIVVMPPPHPPTVGTAAAAVSVGGNTSLLAAGNASVMFEDGIGAGVQRRMARNEKRGGQKIGINYGSNDSTLVTGNTPFEASSGRYVISSAGGGGVGMDPNALSNSCHACGGGNTFDTQLHNSHRHFDPTTSAANNRRLVDATMQSLGYSVGGGLGYVSPIRDRSVMHAPPIVADANAAAAPTYAGPVYEPSAYAVPAEGCISNASARAGTVSPRRSEQQRSASGGVRSSSNSNQRYQNTLDASAASSASINELKDRIEKVLDDQEGLNGKALRALLSVIEGKGQLSDEDRQKVFGAAGTAASGVGANSNASSAAASSSHRSNGTTTATSSSNVRVKYHNIIAASEKHSGAKMPDASAVLDRIGQHMQAAFDLSDEKRGVRIAGNDTGRAGDITYGAFGDGISGSGGGYVTSRSRSRGQAAGYTHRDNLRSSARVGTLPNDRLSVTHNSSTLRSQSAAIRANNHYNPLVLGTQVVGCRGLVGSKGNSSLALGSCAVGGAGGGLSATHQRKDPIPKANATAPNPTTKTTATVSGRKTFPAAFLQPSSAKARPQGRSRSAEVPKDNIRSLYYQDGIVGGNARPAGRKAVAGHSN